MANCGLVGYEFLCIHVVVLDLAKYVDVLGCATGVRLLQ